MLPMICGDNKLGIWNRLIFIIVDLVERASARLSLPNTMWFLNRTPRPENTLINQRIRVSAHTYYIFHRTNNMQSYVHVISRRYSIRTMVSGEKRKQRRNRREEPKIRRLKPLIILEYRLSFYSVIPVHRIRTIRQLLHVWF